VTNAIDVIVTCTEQKTVAPVEALKLRSLAGQLSEERVTNWMRRLTVGETGRIPAEELYKGNHWYVVRSLASRNGGARPEVRVWIASAGYGLIPLHARLQPYSATFAGGMDSVGSVPDAQYWWQRLSEWSGPIPDYPRSIQQLAANNNGAPLLIAASAVYIRALHHDLTEVLRQPEAHARIGVISAGMKKIGTPFREYLLPADARSQSLVKGQMHSLNARLLQHALEIWDQWSGDICVLKEIFSCELDEQPPAPSYARQPLSDSDILKFIRRELDRQPSVGHSTLLRSLRQSGRACEQTRFRELFRAYKLEMNL
jgi:hypothetical protein